MMALLKYKENKNLFLNLLKHRSPIAQVDSLHFIVLCLDNRSPVSWVLSVPNNTHINVMPGHCVKTLKSELQKYDLFE